MSLKSSLRSSKIKSSMRTPHKTTSAISSPYRLGHRGRCRAAALDSIAGRRGSYGGLGRSNKEGYWVPVCRGARGLGEKKRSVLQAVKNLEG